MRAARESWPSVFPQGADAAGIGKGVHGSRAGSLPVLTKGWPPAGP
jgi:hypothetical protein